MKTTTLILLSLLSCTTSSALTASPSQSRSSTSTTTSSSSSSSTDNSWWQPIPPGLQDFIAQFNSPHGDTGNDLRKRQHGIGGAAPEATTSIATQMSPVTTYFVNNSPVVYTQTFAPTPDPWSGPANGQIGLGTIQGVVGTVRSD